MANTIGANALLEMRVNEIIKLQPETVALFKQFGIDSCCGGARPLGEVIERHRLDEAAVLEALGVSPRA